jgi:hypothetical protein
MGMGAWLHCVGHYLSAVVVHVQVVLVPLWVPPGLLSFATAAPEIKEADVELLKSQVSWR